MSLVTALEAPLSISNAIKKASRATGVDFSYLLKTAARESAFNKSAKAKTSSAAGLFQFIESTWLKTVVIIIQTKVYGFTMAFLPSFTAGWDSGAYRKISEPLNRVKKA